MRAYLWGIEILLAFLGLYSENLLRAYLWGIEICETIEEYNLIKEIASLPMRNWNIDCFAKSRLDFALRAYLWGIEILPHTQMPLHPRLIASLPMRNWNIVWPANFLYFKFIASLPMRNWNFYGGVRWKFKCINCEPTYEELKLKKEV